MEYIFTNIKFLKSRFFCAAGALFGLQSIILSFVSWDELGVKNWCYKLLIFMGIILASVVFAVISLLVKRKNVLWKQGERTIQAMYGDLFKIANKKKREKIIVIQVNTNFDTTVGGRIVAPDSVHGRWLKRFIKGNITPSRLDRMIQESLAQQKITPVIQDRRQKPEGNQATYPRGTVAVVDDGNTHYYLVALTHFDENMNAQCSKKEFLEVIDSLIDFYNRNGQGMPIYIPLMGTGISRTDITQNESLQIITSLLKLNRAKIHGQANVVVYNKLKTEVSIFDL